MPNPNPLVKLNHREQEIVDHLKRFCPSLYRDLKKSGQLELEARRMQEDYENQFYDLTINQKLPRNQAEELVRDVRLPEPEGPEPKSQDPTSPTTTK